MTVANLVMDAVVGDFLLPTINRLAEQLNRNIHLKITLRINDTYTEKQIASEGEPKEEHLPGEVRIAASDTAVADRYKYALQCVFENQEHLKGFSGIRSQGSVKIADAQGSNDQSGFVYCYNEWGWNRKLSDF